MYNLKIRFAALGLAGAAAISLAGCAAGGSTSGLNPESPTTITVWNYYNGDQLAAFDALVAEFNSTIGLEEGIIVSSVSQGSIDNLADQLLDAADGKVGAQDVPDLAAVYSETAYILANRDMLVDLDAYFTPEELEGYVPGFIEEGRMVAGGSLLLFPVSKSTECFAVNLTDWQPFAEASGITPDSITSVEQLVAAAEQYYLWTDSLTATPEDGKALYGRDSLANYLYIGAAQLGHELFLVDENGVTVNLDRDTFKTLWDNYYVPYINGWFTAGANYRSEDMKTGTVLALTASTSGVSYLPTAVTDLEDVSHDIEIAVSKSLCFEGGDDAAVQQGAGYCVTKSDELRQQAAVEFLKWFTEPERNLAFAAQSGYSPVTLAANTEATLRAQLPDAQESAKAENMLNALLVSAEIYSGSRTYTCKPFEGSKQVRSLLETELKSITETDCAAVNEAVAAGTPRAEAAAPYMTDEYFDAWFAALCDKVAATVG